MSLDKLKMQSSLVWNVINFINMIKKLFILTLFSFIFSAKIYVVDYPGQADFKAYQVKYNGQADILVHEVKYPGQAGNSD